MVDATTGLHAYLQGQHILDYARALTADQVALASDPRPDSRIYWVAPTTTELRNPVGPILCPTDAIARDVTEQMQLPTRVLPITAEFFPVVRSGYDRHELREALFGPAVDDQQVVVYLPRRPELGVCRSLAAVWEVLQKPIHIVASQLTVQMLVNCGVPADRAQALSPQAPLSYGFEAADIFIVPPDDPGYAIELGMTLGAVPAVGNDIIWASRVDQDRGYELPIWVGGNEPDHWDYLFDPSGCAQILEAIDVPGLRQKHLNIRAWAHDARDTKALWQTQLRSSS